MQWLYTVWEINHFYNWMKAVESNGENR